MPDYSDPRANTSLKVCNHCDAVVRRIRLAPGERATCPRCGHELYRNNERRYRLLLPVVLASLIVFVISNAFPIVTMEIQGLSSQTTVWGAVRALSLDDMMSVSALVFLTTMLFPPVELALLAYLLIPLRMNLIPPGFGPVVRFVHVARPWGMIEVFMLGIVAALVKLSSLAQVLPGTALWSFAVLTILLAIVVAFDPAELWDVAQGREGPYRAPAQEIR